MDALQRDKCWGRRLARVGVNPTTRSTRTPDTVERAIRWRWLARQSGLGNASFRGRPTSDPGAPRPA